MILWLDEVKTPGNLSVHLPSPGGEVRPVENGCSVCLRQKIEKSSKTKSNNKLKATTKVLGRGGLKDCRGEIDCFWVIEEV